jgi:hypothetical protein
MKSIGKIMEEMGFNPQASSSSKAAFVKNLIKQAYNVDVEIPEIYKNDGEHSLQSKITELKQKRIEPEQLQLDLGDLKKA